MSGISRYDLSHEDWATPPAEAPLNCQVSWMSRSKKTMAYGHLFSRHPIVLELCVSAMIMEWFFQRRKIPLPEDSDPRCFLVGGEESSHILLGTVNAGIYISDDRGETWRQPQTPISDTNIQVLPETKSDLAIFWLEPLPVVFGKLSTARKWHRYHHVFPP